MCRFPVTAVNESLDSNPELVNSDPYGEGWMVEIAPSAGIEQALASASLLDADAYTASTGG